MDEPNTQPENETLPQQQVAEQQRDDYFGIRESVLDVPEPTPVDILLDEMYAKACPLHSWRGASEEMNRQASNDDSAKIERNLGRVKD